MGLVVEELSQLDSDLVWFAKGHWVMYSNGPSDNTFCEGNDIQCFETMVERYHPSKGKMIMIDLAQLAAKAVMDMTYPVKEFSEFFMFWDMLARKRLDEGETVPSRIVTEAMLMILMRWDTDESYQLMPPSWPIPTRKKKEHIYANLEE